MKRKKTACPAEENLHYDAFISYRHLSPDQEVAGNLLTLLENYKPPRTNVPLSRKRIERVFMDKAELPINSDLTESLKLALRNSDYLIVILSKEYQKSKYCIQEVEYFKELHHGSMEKVLPVLIDGEPSEVLFDALIHQSKRIQKEDGSTELADVEFEPICCDIRGVSHADILQKLKKSEFLRIAAAIYECPYDTFYQRHKKRKIKRIKIAVAAGAAFAAGVFLAWKLLFPEPLSVKIGEHVLFGRYEQDDNTSNGKEPLEWMVLNQSGEYALLMTVNTIDVQPFASDLSHTDWEKSYLREWLNGSFYQEAFTLGEQNGILLSNVSKDVSALYEARNESTITKDRVYVLGFNEISNYLETEQAMIAAATPYALSLVKNGGLVNDTTGGSVYWLRSPGNTKYNQSCINHDGACGSLLSIASGFVRPVIQVDLRVKGITNK